MDAVVENELLTKTGPGTLMGNLFRRYWIPVMLSAELAEPDGAPVRVSLLSEKLLAFRDTQGKIGLMDEFCAHRRVSLWFGRNEENGLRCPYHGWKYDVTGQCVEVPSEAKENGFCTKIKLTSYPCAELGGVIWTYMGPPELKPALPAFEWVSLSESHCYISRRSQESNYLQALEGGIDSSHVSFLHSGELDTDPLHRNTQGAKYARSKSTTFDILESPGGLIIGARRDAEPGHNYWRITPWIMPWYTLIPPYSGNALNGHVWVPMDDGNCMAWSITFHPSRPLSDEEREAMVNGKGVHVELIPGTTIPTANRSNDYLIDRQAQKIGRYYSGVKGLAIQDASLQESMGPVVDRSKENLVSTDNPIILARRRLLQAAKALQKGAAAPGLKPEDQRVRSASFVLSADVHFKEKTLDSVKVREGEPHVAV
ncbi:MAG: Rieske (2Fe-2S) protein [Herbaspirillum sp.]|nr:Rieske (2Fe-2S) protein [Herbaspirillum sp.]